MTTETLARPDLLDDAGVPSRTRLWVAGLLTTGVVVGASSVVGILFGPGRSDDMVDWLDWTIVSMTVVLMGCIVGLWPAAWALIARRRALARGERGRRLASRVAGTTFVAVIVPGAVLNAQHLSDPFVVVPVVAGAVVIALALGLAAFVRA